MPSAPIETHYINNFRSGIDQAFQQRLSKFRSRVTVGRQSAEFDFFDRVGIADDMAEVTTRYGTNPIMEVPHARRRIGLKDWDWGKPIDEKDLIRVSTDPTNAYTQGGLAAANRKLDDIIVDVAFAPAHVGKGGEDTINFVGTNSGKITVGAVSNEAGHIRNDSAFAVTAGAYEGIDIAKNFTYGTPADTGLTKNKLMAVKETMLGTLALDQEELPIINAYIGRRQWRDLLMIEEVVNSDYAMKARLESMTVTEWGGFRFINSERLPGGENERHCMFFLPQAIQLNMSQEIQADMWRLPDRKNIPYIYIKLGAGGSRMWGECLARVRCAE